MVAKRSLPLSFPLPLVASSHPLPLQGQGVASQGEAAEASFEARFAAQQEALLWRYLPGALVAKALALPVFAVLWPPKAWSVWVGALLSVLAVLGLLQGVLLLMRRRGAVTLAPLLPVVALGGCAYSGLLLLVLPALSDAGRFVLGVFAVAYLLGGTLLYAPAVRLALAWLLSTGSVLGLGLAFSPWAGADSLAALTPLLVVLLAFALRETELRARQNLRGRDRIEAERQMLALMLQDFEAQASDSLWELDPWGRFTHVSANLAQRLGRPAATLIGQPLTLLVDEPAAGQPVPAEHTALAERLAAPTPFADWILSGTLGGRLHWWRLRGRPLLDERGLWSGWRGVAQDVTELMHKQIELERMALTDMATGLPNRHGFLMALREQLLNRGCSRVVVVVLDLDDFKRVTHALGPTGADAVLLALAHGLNDVAQACGLELARLDGDEFALHWVEDAPGRLDPLALADSLRATVALCPLPGVHDVQLSATIGLTLHTGAEASADELLRQAYLALVQAKRSELTSVCVYEPAVEEAQCLRTALIQDLREAVEARQIDLVYQAKVDLVSGELVGLEALARWNHPLRGPIPPAEFVPLAEAAGLIQALGQVVLERACSEAARWPKTVRVAVNVSALQLEAKDFIDRVRQALLRGGLPAHRLELELTESVCLRQDGSLEQRLHSLRELGVSVALDDFGTGYSSLSYLQRLPLSTLKVDRAFVAGLDADDSAQAACAQAIVRTVLQLAKAIGASPVAEGIETPAQLALLRDMGCSVGQGFLLGRPLSLAQVEAQFQTRGGPTGH